MIQTKRKPPSTRRTFVNSWGELEYLCKKVAFWLYVRKQPAAANRFLNRLEHVLRQVPNRDMAIVRHEGLALLHELNGEIGDAIAHRKKEITLMQRLHNEAYSPNCSAETRDYMLRDRDEVALQERQDILDRLQAQTRLERNHVNGR